MSKPAGFPRFSHGEPAGFSHSDLMIPQSAPAVRGQLPQPLRKKSWAEL